jgi:hypothetical protein
MTPALDTSVGSPGSRDLRNPGILFLGRDVQVGGVGTLDGVSQGWSRTLDTWSPRGFAGAGRIIPFAAGYFCAHRAAAAAETKHAPTVTIA